MSASGRNEKTQRTKKKGFMEPGLKLVIELIIFAMFLAACVFLLMQIAPGIKDQLMKQLGISAVKNLPNVL